MSASSTCAGDKAHPLAVGDVGRSVLAVAVGAAILTAVTYVMPVKLRLTDLRPPSAKTAIALIPDASAAPAPQPWHEPEAPPRASLVGSSDHPAPSVAKGHPRAPSTAAQNGAGGRFDTISIAAFLRTVPAAAKTSKGARRNRAATFAVSDLEADGIAEEPTAPVKQGSAEDLTTAVKKASAKASSSKDTPGDSSLAFATALGQIETAAHAGVMNGQPAAALNIGLTTGPVVIDASGMSEVTNLSEPGGFRKTFKLSTRASIPLD